MEALVQWLDSSAFAGNVAISVVVILAAMLGRSAAMRWWAGSTFPTDEIGLRWRSRIRNLTILVILLALTVVWATELRTLALSAVAIAAAIVIATKELIMCFGGGALRAATESFGVGDRIEVKGIRGDVVHYGFLTTTVLEIGPNHQRTGRAVVIPNSILLAESVINESFTEEYVLHTFSVPVAREGWEVAEANLLEAANAVCAPFVETAQTHIDAISSNSGLPAFNSAPRVTLQVNDPEKLMLLVRVPSPAVEKGRVEQEILRDYLSRAVIEATQP